MFTSLPLSNEETVIKKSVVDQFNFDLYFVYRFISKGIIVFPKHS